MTASSAGSVPKRATMEGFLGDIPVAACGLVTSMGVVALDWILQQALGLDIPSITFWLVVPAGALVAGMASASGYYLGAKWLHHMPSRSIMFNMLAVGASTWFVIQWTSWYTATFSDTGGRVADVIPFLDYWKWKAEHTSYQIGNGGTSTGELGSIGLWAQGIQAVAFVLGGLSMYFILSNERACTTCRRYYRGKKLTKKMLSGEGLVRAFAGAELHPPEVVDNTHAFIGKDAFRGFHLVGESCPSCKDHILRVVVHYGKDQDGVVASFRSSGEQFARLEVAARTVEA